MLAFAQIAIGSGEAVACTACGQRGEVATRPAEEIVASLTAAVSRWDAGPGPNVAFVGSEPFAHPALPQLVAAATDAGCERIRLRTDAGALSQAGNAAGALHAGVRHVEVVLLAGDAEAHDRLAGRAGLFDAALAGVEAFRTAARDIEVPVAVTGWIPICRHNADCLVGAITALARMGAVSVLAHPVVRYQATPQVTAAALRAATVCGVALHGPGFSPFSAEPWYAAEERS